MKKFPRLIFLVLLSALSCSRQPMAVPDGTSELAVCIEEATRIQLKDSITVWNTGDSVSVFYRSDLNRAWVYAGADCASSGIIRGSVPAVSDEGDIFVLYPYDAQASLSGNIISTLIPTRQTFREDSFGRGAAVMAGRTESETLTLTYATAFVSLNLSGEAALIDSLVLRSAAGEKLSGPCTLDMDSYPVAAAAEGQDRVVLESVNFDGAPSSCMLSIAPGTYASGFHVCVYFSDGRLSIVRDELCRTLLPGHVHNISVSIQGDDGRFTMKIPFLKDGHGYSPFDGVEAEQGKAKVLKARSFKLKDYPQYTLDFVMNRIRLIWGNNNGLELWTREQENDSPGSVKIPAVEGKSLKSFGMVVGNANATDVALSDSEGNPLEYTRRESLPEKYLFADVSQAAPGTACFISFNQAMIFFLTEFVFIYE